MCMSEPTHIHRRGLLVQYVSEAPASVQYQKCMPHMEVTCHSWPAITLATTLVMDMRRMKRLFI